MFDNEYSPLLGAITGVRETVRDLFDKSSSVSEERTCLAIVDLERFINKGKSFLGNNIERTLVLQQLAHYMAWARNLAAEDPNNENDVTLVRRLQMLSYSQFWEALAVQRLLRALVKTACGDEYEPRALLDENVDSYSVYKEIRQKCLALSPELEKLLTVLYKNQIRNAFAHSDYYIAAGYICFMNYDHTKSHMLPSIQVNTWERLFGLFDEFVGAVFEARHELLDSLAAKLPFRVDLPEFAGAFLITRDDHRYWIFTRTT